MFTDLPLFVHLRRLIQSLQEHDWVEDFGVERMVGGREDGVMGGEGAHIGFCSNW